MNAAQRGYKTSAEHDQVIRFISANDEGPTERLVVLFRQHRQLSNDRDIDIEIYSAERSRYQQIQ